MLVQNLKSRVQEMFEGGVSLDVSWYDIMRQAASRMTSKILVPNLFFREELYGGASTGVSKFFAPDRLYKAQDIVDKDGNIIAKYVSLPEFEKHKDTGGTGVFTVKYEDGQRRIEMLADLDVDDQEVIIDTFDSLSNKVGSSDIQLDTYNFVEGTASVKQTYDTNNNSLLINLAQPLDLSNYVVDGSLFMNIFFQNVQDVVDVEVRLETDSTNYYTSTFKANGIMDDMKNGWNYARLRVNSIQQSGSPNYTNINAVRVIITTNSPQKINIDLMSIKKVTPIYVRAYSNYAFISAASGKWIDTPENDNDIVNLDNDAFYILTLECAMDIIQDGTYTNLKGVEANGILYKLQDAYNTYKHNNQTALEAEGYNYSDTINLDDIWT